MDAADILRLHLALRRAERSRLRDRDFAEFRDPNDVRALDNAEAPCFRPEGK